MKNSYMRRVVTIVCLIFALVSSASGLWGIYDYYSEKGMLKVKDKEIERLRRIAETKRTSL